jgi:hypothetical protein
MQIPREQFIPNCVMQLVVTIGQQWYAKEFEEPEAVNAKIVRTAADLYSKIEADLAENKQVVQGPGLAPGVIAGSPFVKH